jgi:hypothetical protein
MIQPPKMSPLGLQSAGIASVRDASSPLGSVEFRRLSLDRIPPSPGCGHRPASYVALQYEVVNVFGNANDFHIAMRKVWHCMTLPGI